MLKDKLELMKSNALENIAIFRGLVDVTQINADQYLKKIAEYEARIAETNTEIDEIVALLRKLEGDE